MFMILLLVNFILAILVCFIVASVFKSPINKILQRLISDEIYTIWTKYIIFAVYIVGISGGVRVWDLEKYISPQTDKGTILELNADRWVLEIYRTVIGTLQSVAWMLLLFFIFALIGYVIVKGLEMRKQNKS